MARPQAPREFDGLAQIAGHSALDFLNTVKYRGRAQPGDRLNSFADIVRWAHLAGLITSPEGARLERVSPDTAARLCGEIVALREQARRLFPRADARNDVRAAADVAREISALRPVARIDPKSGALSRHIPLNGPEDLKARIVGALAELLEQRPGLAIKSCEGHDCDWLFIDHSKAKRRRWCDTRICGNAARVRRHRDARTGAKQGLRHG